MLETKKYIAIVTVRKRDVNGNTYHKVQILDLFGNTIAEVKRAYGGGYEYERTACRLITAWRSDDRKPIEANEIMFIVK